MLIVILSGSQNVVCNWILGGRHYNSRFEFCRLVVRYGLQPFNPPPRGQAYTPTRYTDCWDTNLLTRMDFSEGDDWNMHVRNMLMITPMIISSSVPRFLHSRSERRAVHSISKGEPTATWEKRYKTILNYLVVMAASLARTRRLASSQALFEGSQSSRLALSDSHARKYIDFFINFDRKQLIWIKNSSFNELDSLAYLESE